MVLRVQTPLEDSLDQLLTLLMIYMCIIIGRNALIEATVKIFDRGIFEVIEAERHLSLNCVILTTKKS